MSARLSHVIVVMLVFVVIGPILGTLCFGVLTALSALESPQSSASIIIASLAFLPLAYMIGGVQAFVTGTVTAIRSWRQGTCPLWVPVLAAFVSGVVIQIRSFENIDVAVTVTLIHLLAATGCWLMLYYALGWNKNDSQS